MDDNGNFETIDELVAFLIRDNRCEEADARCLIEGIIESAMGDGRDATPEFCWGTIVDFGYLDSLARSGWVTREGKMLSATWGAHERLLDLLKIGVKDVEEQGWARVTVHSWQCGYRLSREQRRRIEECGLLVEAATERLKPHWRPSVANPVPTPSR